jgi:hypothetical protein
MPQLHLDEQMTDTTARKKPTKKEKERLWLEHFRKAYQGEFPAGVVKYDENPDVLVIDPARIVGIEITEFHLIDGGLPQSEPQQALRRAGVVEEARRLYLAEGGKDIELTFGFRYISADRRKKLPAELAAFAKRIENNVSEMIWLEASSTPEEIAFAWNAGVYQNTVWKVQQVNKGSLTSKDKLVEIIRSKEEKVKGYQKCDAYWLLICVNFSDPAQDQEIRIDDPYVHSDVFERIFMFKSVFNEIVAVK